MKFNRRFTVIHVPRLFRSVLQFHNSLMIDNLERKIFLLRYRRFWPRDLFLLHQPRGGDTFEVVGTSPAGCQAFLLIPFPIVRK